MAFSLFKRNKNKGKTQGGHPMYYLLRVKEVIKETADAVTIVFEQPVDTPIQYESGQFLTLIHEIDGKEVRRAYSLNSSPFVDQDISVTVKRVEGGLMSNFLHDNIEAGSDLKVMEPMGKFTTTFVKEKKRHIIMFAGGSGVTPLMSITKSLLHEEPESIVSIIYCNRNIESIIFEKKFEKNF